MPAIIENIPLHSETLFLIANGKDSVVKIHDKSDDVTSRRNSFNTLEELKLIKNTIEKRGQGIHKKEYELDYDGIFAYIEDKLLLDKNNRRMELVNYGLNFKVNRDIRTGHLNILLDDFLRYTKKYNYGIKYLLNEFCLYLLDNQRDTYNKVKYTKRDVLRNSKDIGKAIKKGEYVEELEMITHDGQYPWEMEFIFKVGLKYGTRFIH